MDGKNVVGDEPAVPALKELRHLFTVKRRPLELNAHGPFHGRPRHHQPPTTGVGRRRAAQPGRGASLMP